MNQLSSVDGVADAACAALRDRLLRGAAKAATAARPALATSRSRPATCSDCSAFADCEQRLLEGNCSNDPKDNDSIEVAILADEPFNWARF